MRMGVSTVGNESESSESILSRLGQVLGSARTSDLERRRCLRELEIVHRRLVSREYVQSNFLERALLTLPDRTDEIFKELLFFWSVGEVWKELFHAVKLPPSARILDIGCGFFPKAEVGLYYCGFQGAVSLLDVCPQALAHAVKFLKFFQVDFRTRRLACSVWDLPAVRFDFIIANHVLDDLLLDAAARSGRVPLAEAYRSERVFSQLWSGIVQDPVAGAALMDRLADVVLSRLNPRGVVLFVDYPSYTHRALGQGALLRFVRQRQQDLRSALEARGLELMQPIRNGRLRRDRLVVRDSHVICGRIRTGNSGRSWR